MKRAIIFFAMMFIAFVAFFFIFVDSMIVRYISVGVMGLCVYTQRKIVLSEEK